MPQKLSRRTFLRTVGSTVSLTIPLTAASFVGAPLFLPGRVLGADGAVSPNEKIVMGMIGQGNQGRLDLTGFLMLPQAHVAAVCDVVDAHAVRAAQMVHEAYGNSDCRRFRYSEEITQADGFDVVYVGTPEHWHPYLAIDAMRHGKDVYCEKPETVTVRDGQLMRQTAIETGRVFSGGSQRVWNDYWKFHKIVRAGFLGKPTEGYANPGLPGFTARALSAEPIPEGVDWNRWLGPAPWRPFNRAYLTCGRGNGWFDFTGSNNGWGAHCFGGLMFAMELDYSGPTEIVPPQEDESGLLTFRFANGCTLHTGGTWGSVPGFRHGLPSGNGGEICVRGTDGSLCEADIANGTYPVPEIEVPNYRGEVFQPRAGMELDPDFPMFSAIGQSCIMGDFLHCVRTREVPFRNVERCHRVCSVGHLGRIACLLGRTIHFDPETENVVGDPVAQRLLDRPRREPWTLETMRTEG